MSNAVSESSRKPSGFIIELNREATIVRVTWLGEITLAVVREGFSTTREFAAKLEIAGAISDFSHVLSFNLSHDDVYALTQERPVFKTEIPRITVSGTDHIFGTARMFELMSNERSKGIHVVRTMDEAYSLLQLKSPEFKPVEIA